MPVHNADALREQMAVIDELNEELDDLLLLKSIEVDILKDGSLDLPDDVLNTKPWDEIAGVLDR